MKPSFLEPIGTIATSKKNLLCAHGLNQQPKALIPLLEKISAMGFNTYLLHLPGHFEGEDFATLNGHSYLKAYRKCHQHLSDQSHSPLYFLGYSFGGLIGAHELKTCPYEKMILLAPALRLRTYSTLLQYVLPFIKRVVSIKFGNDDFEKRYRYHQSGVPKEIYSSFFEIYKSFIHNEKSNSSLAASQALLMLHSGDELVSFKKMKKMSKNYPHWTFEQLHNDGAEFKKYKHLCFDSLSLGTKNFEAMLYNIQNFLKIG